MLSRRRRSYYQQITAFERGRVTGLREGFSSMTLQEALAGLYQLCMIVGSGGQGMVLPQKDRVTGYHVATTEKKDRRIQSTAVEHRTVSAAEIQAAIGITVTQRTDRNWLHQGQLQARRPVVCIPLTPSHCHLRCLWCQARAH
ncbi:uncharacterized protein TNCV_3505821 [Trichonephila clavipes]|uniref:Transposase Tc1-like domain-containing protein n=1 Tax=Trichonephila clavipes TaxID=2585209 RepID=A0A8X6RVR2_TRICX|nr:uncharacterized protein TNCV_3505821 [Trichonephila clavipes]